MLQSSMIATVVSGAVMPPTSCLIWGKLQLPIQNLGLQNIRLAYLMELCCIADVVLSGSTLHIAKFCSNVRDCFGHYSQGSAGEKKDTVSWPLYSTPYSSFSYLFDSRPSLDHSHPTEPLLLLW